MKAFRVLRAGPSTTFQDAGRGGLRRYGLPVSGAMDQFSFRIANILVCNTPDLAVLEVLLQGFAVEAMSEQRVAITGADLGAFLNDQPAPMWEMFSVHPGDRLSFKKRTSGCRAYLAVGGGFRAPTFFGSRSTFAKGKMGAPLREGDILRVDGLPTPLGNVSRRMLPFERRPVFSSAHCVRVIMGPQDDCFSRQGIQTFVSATYSISPKSDRHGIRTEGPAIEFQGKPDIISDPTPLGAVQVPGDGKPIILHRDGQVTGGYAKIATVISADLDKFGQMVPGDTVRFERVTRVRALSVLGDAS